MAWAAATAMRVAEPASEKARSRRDGTSKAWVTWITVNSTASGPSTEAMSPALAAPEMVAKNQTKAVTTARARMILRKGKARFRRR